MNLLKIKNFIYKNIGYIALYLSAIHILFYFLHFYNRTIPDFVYQTLQLLNFGGIDLVYLRNDFLTITFQFGSSYTTRPALSILFSFLFLIGAILYIKSKSKENRILDFVFLLLFLAKGIVIINLVIAISVRPEAYLKPQLLILLLKMALIFFVILVYLRRSFREKQLVQLEDEAGIKIYLNNGGFPETLHYKKASRGQRFWIYLIDVLLIFGVFSKYIFLIPRSFETLLVSTFGERFSLYILFIIASSLYYLFFEAIFKTTPGKCLMNTRIINYKKGKIKFSQFVWRTLSRRIPFEPFSFFGDIGWHDLLSTTTVVKQNSDEEYNLVVKSILIIFALLIIGIAVENLLKGF
ncbi:MAG: RDD family protein [Bacteroidota bacterium]